MSLCISQTIFSFCEQSIMWAWWEKLGKMKTVNLSDTDTSKLALLIIPLWIPCQLPAWNHRAPREGEKKRGGMILVFRDAVKVDSKSSLEQWPFQKLYSRGESSTGLGHTGRQQNLPSRKTSEQFEDVCQKSSSTGSASGLEAGHGDLPSLVKLAICDKPFINFQFHNNNSP